MSYAEFCITMKVLCVLFSCSETSGIRTADHNTEVGGVNLSRHQVVYGGKARDLVPDESTPEKRKEVKDAAIKLGLWAQDEGDHVHIHDNDF